MPTILDEKLTLLGFAASPKRLSTCRRDDRTLHQASLAGTLRSYSRSGDELVASPRDGAA